jgi:hypothetical protein
MPDGSVNPMRYRFSRGSKKRSRVSSGRRLESTGQVEQTQAFTLGVRWPIFFWIESFPLRAYNMERTGTYPKTYG